MKFNFMIMLQIVIIITVIVRLIVGGFNPDIIAIGALSGTIIIIELNKGSKR